MWARLQHLPFFALSSRFFQGLHSSFYRATMVYDNALTKALISIQHYTFLPMMLVARFGEGCPARIGLQQQRSCPGWMLRDRTLSLSRGLGLLWDRVQQGKRLYLEGSDCTACSMQASTR